MTVEEFLKTTKTISVSSVAKLMWPDNAAAASRLLTKLSEKSKRPFTDEDSKLALKALRQIGASFNEIDGYTQD